MSEPQPPPVLPVEEAEAKPEFETEAGTQEAAQEAEAEGDIDPLPTGTVLARIAGDQLYRLALIAQFGVIVVGGLLALVVLGQSLGPGGSLRIVLTIALIGLASLVAGQSLRAFGALLHVHADQADATGRIEQHLAAGLERLSTAFEEASSPRSAPRAATGVQFRLQQLAEVRHAIRAGHWQDADDLVHDFTGSNPDDPEAAQLPEELATARQAASQEFLSKIAAAREVNDPDRVIELRDALKPLLAPDAMRSLDRDLARWFILLIHKRLRSGTVRVDVAVLAGRVADSLDDTPEGASLRASLPTLRRAAGLCPRCAQPYTGLAAACPNCLASQTSPPAPATPMNTVALAEPEPDILPERDPEDSPFVAEPD